MIDADEDFDLPPVDWESRGFDIQHLIEVVDDDERRYHAKQEAKQGARNEQANHTFTGDAQNTNEPPPPKRKARTWAECKAEIYARKDEPWIGIRIGQTVIAECRNGSFVPLVAPSGAGKSTLAMQMLIDHAVNRGPSVYVTYELDGDEAVARGIGQMTHASWASVLRGEVAEDVAPDVERLRILERENATMANLRLEVAELRKEYPDQPIFVVVDYMQATPAPPGKERGFVANVSSELRKIAKELRVVLIGVSQASTNNSQRMRSGELLGIESAATGAETSQIERDAYVILTLGDRQDVDPDTVSWKLSVAKFRMGQPDMIHELHYKGRIGDWEVVGDPRKASEVRDEKRTAAAEAKAAAKGGDLETKKKKLLKVIGQYWMDGKQKYCTARKLRETKGIGKTAAPLALEELVDESKLEIVEIEVTEGGRTKKRDVYSPVAPSAAA